MSDWSKHAAQRFLEKEKVGKEEQTKEQQKELLRERKTLVDQDLLQSRAPEMWSDLYLRFQASCEEFNLDAGKPILAFAKIDENTIEIVLELDPNIKTKLIFDPNAYTIKFSGLAVGETDRLDIRIEQGTTEPKFFDHRGRVIGEPARIVQTSLEDILA